MDSSLSFEQSCQLQATVGVFLEKVLLASREVMGDCIPDYRVAFAEDGHYLMRKGRIIMFWTVVTGDTGPEGRIDRSTNWVGFSTVSDKVLEQLDTETRRVCLELLEDSP